MSCETALIIHVRAETATDSGNGLTFNLHGLNAQALPTPVVLVDGVAASAGSYVFNRGDADTRASVTFNSTQAGRTVTVDYTWRLECSAHQDLSVFEFERELNVREMKDVNGRMMVAEAYEKATAWKGLLVWEYADQSFWDEIRRIAESPGTTFDLERNSLDSPLDLLVNLYPAAFPKYRETPGVPGNTQISLPVIQIS